MEEDSSKPELADNKPEPGRSILHLPLPQQRRLPWQVPCNRKQNRAYRSCNSLFKKSREEALTFLVLSCFANPANDRVYLKLEFTHNRSQIAINQYYRRFSRLKTTRP